MIAGQPALPAGRQQPERVPALTPPRVRGFAALKDDVIDGTLGEAAAGSETGMTRADDNCSDAFDGQTTSTVTLTGFVITSYTADRFCDCATSASISFLDALASILNVTLISS